jgi:hypothetical protein
MTTKKREYEKPSMKVVVLNQQTAMLAGSVKTTDYTLQDYEEE